MNGDKDLQKRSFDVIGVGGANMDVQMKVRGGYVLHDSNPGRILLSPGGVTRNVLENLARLGADCSMVTAVGKDAFGDGILKSLAGAGIGAGSVYVSDTEPSSSYIALLDGSGDMFIGACDALILENMPASFIRDRGELLRSAKAVVCDTNLTEEQLSVLTEEAGDVPLFLDPVSAAKAERVKGLIGRFYCMKPNRMELEVLSGMDCENDADIRRACGKLLSKGLFSVAVSLGQRGCYYADAEGNAFFKEPVKVLEMVNASGAGDAFTAGLVYSYLKAFSPEKTVETALRCGSIAVMSKETINPAMCEALVLGNQ